MTVLIIGSVFFMFSWAKFVESHIWIFISFQLSTTYLNLLSLVQKFYEVSLWHHFTRWKNFLFHINFQLHIWIHFLSSKILRGQSLVSFHMLEKTFYFISTFNHIFEFTIFSSNILRGQSLGSFHIGLISHVEKLFILF